MTDVLAPPTSLEDEREILSAVLDWAPAIRACLELGLQPEHFYFEKHRHIFRAQRASSTRDTHADELVTWAALQRLGLDVDRSYLSELAGVSTNAPNVHARVRQVIDLAGKRSKLEGAQKILEGVGEARDDRSADLIQQGLQLVTADFTVEAEPTSSEELIDDFLQFLNDEAPAEVFEMPWAPLNRCVLGGLRRGEVMVLGGWSNMGKTFVLDQMLRGFHEQGKKSAIFATEMSRRERVARYVTARTGIAIEKLLLKQLDKADYAKIVKALPDLPFDYFECHGWGADKIAERMVFGDYDVAAVDTVNLIPGMEEAKVASRAAARFAEVARRADLHLILVSHLNRKRVSNQSGVLPRPVKSDLRDSAMFENNAHQVLFLHMDQDDEANVLPSGELYFDKVKNGMKGKVPVELTPRYLEFVIREFDPPAVVAEPASQMAAITLADDSDLGKASFEQAAKPVHDREAA